MLPKATSMEKYFNWKSCQIRSDSYLLSILFQSFIFFFFVKTCNLIFIWKEKKSLFSFFFWRDLFYKIDVQRKSQHQEETIFGATIKLKNKERNTKPKPLSLWLYDYFSQYTQHLIYVFVLHNVYFFIAWFFLIT